MNSRIVSYFMVVVVLALAPLLMARADAPPPDQAPPETQKPMDQEVSGTIGAIDISARIVKLSGTFANKTFKVSPDAQIVISRIPEARLDDLKAGDPVDVSYHEKDGALVATHITRVEQKPPPVEK